MLISQVQVNFIKGLSALSTWSPLNVNRMFFVSHPSPLQRLLKIWRPDNLVPGALLFPGFGGGAGKAREKRPGDEVGCLTVSTVEYEC